jgi:PAS domain S-box-containing protein
MNKILIVDNSLEDRTLLHNTLLQEGYHIFQAKNGAIGFIMALKENPDLIISEVVLPELTGLEMLKKLNKETATNIPLIFLSKKDKKEDVRNGMNAGAEDYLLKPSNKEDLLKAVKRSIKKQQLTKDAIEKALEKNKSLLREAGRIAKIGYWSTDIQSNIRNWSEEVHKIFGTDPLGKTPEYDEALNYFDKESRKRHLEATLNLTNNGVVYDMEFQITNIKKKRLWIQVIGEPIYNSENRIISIRGIVRDITLLKNNQEALKESNERFEFVALATIEAVWDWNLITGRFYRSRTGHKKVFGFDTERVKEEYYNKEQDGGNYHPEIFLHPGDRDRIKKELKRLTASPDINNFLLEYRTPSVDGKFIYIEDKGFIVRDKKGIATRMIGAASNITKRKQAEKLMIDEKLIMEKIAANASLKSILKAIALAVEKQIHNSICSILLMDSDKIHLRYGAAPNLPKDYCLAIDGMAIGPNAGACGTAVHKKKPIFISDISKDPLWKNHKEIVLKYGLKACRSMPIISKKSNIVLGTIAVYYKKSILPKSSELELLKRVSNHVRIAIEKKKATKRLIDSESKYRKLFERNLAGTYQTSIDGQILRTNKTFANIVGYDSSKKLLQQNANIFYFFESDRKAFIKDINKNKKLINREIILKHKNGSKVYLLENCYKRKDNQIGKEIIEGVVIDITKRKNIEKSLEESLSNIEAILESTTDGVLVVNNHGDIVRYNKKFLELWKIPKHIMASMKDDKALDYVLDQLENPQKMVAKVKELYANQEATSSDIIELKDGRIFERNSQPKMMNGSNTGRIWSFRNITKRINAEKEKQQLFALIETSNDIIAFGNMNGDPTFINKAGRKRLNIDENKPISSYRHSDFLSAEQVNLEEEISNDLFNKGRWEGDTYLTNLQTKKKIPVHMSAFVIRDNITGKAIGMGNVSSDITDIRKINKELVQAKEQAENLADFKDQFLANMSHEIRTPLGIIIGFTKILLRNAVDENQKDQLTAIKTSGDTLLVVINDILDLAKIEAGKMTFEKTELKVPDLIDTLLGTFKLKLEEKEQTLETQYDKCIPKWLLGDPVRINQILFNLIGNAIKFTPSGGSIGVRVNLLKQDKEKVFIEIIVSDSGIGIPKDKIDKIFNLYSQSSKSTTREYGGSGLGLHIVKQLIDLMKGTLLVKSNVGIGSTFTSTIPLSKTSIVETKIKPIVATDKKLEPLKNIKILIVDDMRINQFLAKTIIQRLGFKTDIADNGEIAIALLEKNDYDIILMDLQMPKMNGWETCIHIRNKMQGQKARTPIIALSADVSKRDIDRCKEVGMDDYVSKPINETELLDKITRVIPRKNDKIIEYEQEATKICNLKYLKDRLNNKPENIREMLQIILKEVRLIIGQANKSIDAGDWNNLHRKIHSIKPTLILMGLPKEIIATSKQIEENAKKQEHLDTVPAQFIKLEKALEKGYIELEAELKTIKS